MDGLPAITIDIKQWQQKPKLHLSREHTAHTVSAQYHVISVP